MSNKEKMPGAYRASKNTVSAPPESGTITVSGEIAPCRIGYYEVEVKPEEHCLPGRRHSAFTGRTADGRVLDDAEFGVKEEIAARTAEYRRRITALE